MRSLTFLGATDPGDEFVPIRQSSKPWGWWALGTVGSALGIGGQRAHEDVGRDPIFYREETYATGVGTVQSLDWG